jgi:hypothetical protein
MAVAVAALPSLQAWPLGRPEEQKERLQLFLSEFDLEGEHQDAREQTQSESSGARSGAEEVGGMWACGFPVVAKRCEAMRTELKANKMAIMKTFSCELVKIPQVPFGRWRSLVSCWGR